MGHGTGSDKDQSTASITCPFASEMAADFIQILTCNLERNCQGSFDDMLADTIRGRFAHR